MQKGRGSQETWSAQGESLDGINASRPGTSWLLNTAWISAIQQLGNNSPFATILQIWSNRCNMTEPKYVPLKGNSRDEKTKQTNKQKNPRVLMTNLAGGRESQDLWSNFTKWGRAPPIPPQLPPKIVCLELITVPRSRNTKRIPSRTAKTIAGVSEDCTMETEKNWRLWVKSSRVAPQQSGLPLCLAPELRRGSQWANDTVTNGSTSTSQVSDKIPSLPLSPCYFQLQVTSTYLLTPLRHLASQNIGKELLRLKHAETDQEMSLSHTHHRHRTRAELRT